MEILESFPLFLKERGLSYGSGERQEMTSILYELFENKRLGRQRSRNKKRIMVLKNSQWLFYLCFLVQFVHKV